MEIMSDEELRKYKSEAPVFTHNELEKCANRNAKIALVSGLIFGFFAGLVVGIILVEEFGK